MNDDLASLYISMLGRSLNPIVNAVTLDSPHYGWFSIAICSKPQSVKRIDYITLVPNE